MYFGYPFIKFPKPIYRTFTINSKSIELVWILDFKYILLLLLLFCMLEIFDAIRKCMKYVFPTVASFMYACLLTMLHIDIFIQT